jgi:hypothetical protein
MNKNYSSSIKPSAPVKANRVVQRMNGCQKNVMNINEMLFKTKT